MCVQLNALCKRNMEFISVNWRGGASCSCHWISIINTRRLLGCTYTFLIEKQKVLQNLIENLSENKDVDMKRRFIKVILGA
jgi:hypothetical protein